MKAIFIVGRSPPTKRNHEEIQTKIIEEQNQHCDILQTNYLEHYNNNTLKQLFALQYLKKSFKSIENLPDYIFRADDDIFINIPLFDKLIAANSKLR